MEEPAPITSCSAPEMRSGSATATATAQVPPNNPVNPANPGTPVPGYSSALSEIENPNPQPGTNNFYTQDGYGGGSGSPAATAPKANYGGGSYSNCSDT